LFKQLLSIITEVLALSWWVMQCDPSTWLAYHFAESMKCFEMVELLLTRILYKSLLSGWYSIAIKVNIHSKK